MKILRLGDTEIWKFLCSKMKSMFLDASIQLYEYVRRPYVPINVLVVSVIHVSCTFLHRPALVNWLEAALTFIHSFYLLQYRKGKNALQNFYVMSRSSGYMGEYPLWIKKHENKGNVSFGLCSDYYFIERANSNM